MATHSVKEIKGDSGEPVKVEVAVRDQKGNVIDETYATKAQISTVYKAMGDDTYANIMAKASPSVGDVWNSTTAGGNYPAGTNWVYTASSTWDALAGLTDLSGYVPTSRTVNGHALTSDVTVTKEDILGTYGGTQVTDLNAIVFSGFYTCLGTATGAPNSSSSWYVTHVNSNTGNADATQTAVSFGTMVIYYRVKTASAWGSWVQETNRTEFANAGKSLDTIVIKGVKYKVVPCGNASGGNSVAVGEYSVANAIQTTAIGYTSTSSSFYSVAIGSLSKVTDSNSIAIGSMSTVNTSSSVAIGSMSTVNASSSVAIGSNSTAAASNSIAIGFLAKALCNYEFTCDSVSQSITHSFKSTDNIFFRGSDVVATNKTFASYSNGHYLSWYLPTKIDYADTNAILDGINFDGVSYKIPQVSAIEFSNANSALTGLQIGTVKYKTVICGTASGDGSTASGFNSVASGNGSIAIGVSSLSKIDNFLVISSTSTNRYYSAYSPDYIFFFNEDVSNSYTTKSQYINGKAMTDYIGAGSPTIVTTETIEGMIAGTSANFSVTGSGTSGSPYVITPKADLSHPHQHRVYQISVTSAPTADAYVLFKASGTERCLIQFTLNAAGAHGYIINFQNLYGWTRSRNVLNGGTLSASDINTSTATGKTLIDVNDSGMYITYAL